MRQMIRPLVRKLAPALLIVTMLLSLGNALFAAPKANQVPNNAKDYAAWLPEEVRERLVTLPFYTVFDNFQFKVDGTKVTLLGQVAKPNLKSDAEKAVKAIPGVTAVDNQLEVLPLSPADDRIRQATYRAIYSFPSLQRYALRAVPPIHIIVKNGNVTLEGAVANQADKDAAGIRAKTVSGSFSVVNNLVPDNAGPK
jgi:hyperosmotically inducible periplasmic protein